MVRSPCDTHSGYIPNNLVAYHDFRNPDGVTVDQTNVVPIHSVDESHCGNNGSHTPNIQLDVVVADETLKDQSTLKDQGALEYQRTLKEQRTLEDPGSCQLTASKQVVLVDRSTDQCCLVAAGSVVDLEDARRYKWCRC